MRKDVRSLCGHKWVLKSSHLRSLCGQKAQILAGGLIHFGFINGQSVLRPEVRFHFCTFVAVDSNLKKKFSYKNFTTPHSPSFPISPERRTTSRSPNDNPFGIARLTGISLNNCQGAFVLRSMVQGFLNTLNVNVLGNWSLSSTLQQVIWGCESTPERGSFWNSWRFSTGCSERQRGSREW